MKKIYFMAFLFAVLSGLASCSLDDTKRQQMIAGYFTVIGSYPNYKLVSDDGLIVYPSASSIADYGNHKRVYFEVSFYEDDVTTTNNISVIRNAEVKKGTYLIETPFISKEEADKAGITQKDSIFAISNLDNCWLANGYLNAIFKAEFSVDGLNAISPNANLCVTSTADNAVTFTMLYNRHTKKGTTSDLGAFGYSFDISKLNIPGNDSVAVTFETEGIKSNTIKVSRSAFNYAQ